jgi:hypothetical protein
MRHSRLGFAENQLAANLTAESVEITVKRAESDFDGRL